MNDNHFPDDDCARFHPEQELNVIGYDNPLIACDLRAGDVFQDPARLQQWYEAREVWEGDSDRWVHLQLDLLNEGELAAHRASDAHERMLEREDAKHDPWRVTP